MAIGAVIPLAVFAVVLGMVGVRLVLLWRRTRRAPELSLGAGLMLVAASMPFTALGRVPAIATEAVGRSCFAAGVGLAVAGIAAMVYFHYRVFRHGSVWARLLFGLICVMLALSSGYIGLMNAMGASVEEVKSAIRPGAVSLLVTVFVCFTWGGVESLRYYASSRRQLALGLADPVVANRFLLWGVAGLTSSLLLAVIGACVLAGMTVFREPLPLVAMAACGSVMSASWALTFFAPARYQRFIEERARLVPRSRS